jgi:GT2 family glycosyltransferase
MKNRVKDLVSIITLNMNQADVTADFLQSLNISKYKKFEVIVVDQNSKEDPTEKLQNAYKNVTIIKSKKNLGFTGGNNLALKYTKGEYIFCVNNDTIITPYLIQELVQPLKSEHNIGVTSPKILYYDNPEIIQYAGSDKINPYTGRNKSSAKGKKDKEHPEFSESYQTTYAHGCAMMIRYDVIEKVGFLDDDYFIYYEELDFSQRVINAGYKIWYVGNVYILHKESITVGKNSVFKEYYHTKNRILFMRKHAPNNISLIMFYVVFFLLTSTKQLLKRLLHGDFEHIKAYFKAIKWNINYKIK